MCSRYRIPLKTAHKWSIAGSRPFAAINPLTRYRYSTVCAANVRRQRDREQSNRNRYLDVRQVWLWHRLQILIINDSWLFSFIGRSVIPNVYKRFAKKSKPRNWWLNGEKAQKLRMVLQSNPKNPCAKPWFVPGTYLGRYFLPSAYPPVRLVTGTWVRL